METFFLDTETTGLSAATDRIVELAILHESGAIAFDSLINPEIVIPNTASRVHGISNSMVKSSPTFETIWPNVEKILQGNRVVIYNASFDKKFFPKHLECAAEIRCAMLEFAEYQRKRFGSNKRKFKLIDAAEIVGHQWGGDHHRALSDTFACRSVWFHINGLIIPSPVKITSSISQSITPEIISPARAALNAARKSKINQRIYTDPISNENSQAVHKANCSAPQPSNLATQPNPSKNINKRTLFWIVGLIVLLLLALKK